MDAIKLAVHEREETGDGPARRLRAQGLIPGVSYGKGKDATPLTVALEDLKAALAHGHNVVLELDFSSGAKGKGAKGKAKGSRYAVVKQLQFHPTKRSLLHVDLHEVDLAVEIEAPVAIEPVGIPAGVADGGIMEWTVKALPGDIPPVLELDVSSLEIGHHLSVEALTAPSEVTILDEPETILVALVPPRVEQMPAAAEEAEEAAEPEVIGSAPSESEEE